MNMKVQFHLKQGWLIRLCVCVCAYACMCVHVCVHLQAKRVVTYLGRAKPEKLVDELMNELQVREVPHCTQ